MARIPWMQIGRSPEFPRATKSLGRGVVRIYRAEAGRYATRGAIFSCRLYVYIAFASSSDGERGEVSEEPIVQRDQGGASPGHADCVFWMFFPRLELYSERDRRAGSGESTIAPQRALEASREAFERLPRPSCQLSGASLSILRRSCGEGGSSSSSVMFMVSWARLRKAVPLRRKSDPMGAPDVFDRSPLPPGPRTL